jgi:hypothetical protein
MDSRLRGNDEHLYATAREVGEFVEAHRVRMLNVAGPRESRCPGIHARAYALLRTVFANTPPMSASGPWLTW